MEQEEAVLMIAEMSANREPVTLSSSPSASPGDGGSGGISGSATRQSVSKARKTARDIDNLQEKRATTKVTYFHSPRLACAIH